MLKRMDRVSWTEGPQVLMVYAAPYFSLSSAKRKAWMPSGHNRVISHFIIGYCCSQRSTLSHQSFWWAITLPNHSKAPTNGSAPVRGDLAEAKPIWILRPVRERKQCRCTVLEECQCPHYWAAENKTKQNKWLQPVHAGINNVQKVVIWDEPMEKLPRNAWEAKKIFCSIRPPPRNYMGSKENLLSSFPSHRVLQTKVDFCLYPPVVEWSIWWQAENHPQSISTGSLLMMPCKIWCIARFIHHAMDGYMQPFRWCVQCIVPYGAP